MPKLPDALRERDFRLLFLGQIISAFGDRLLPVAHAFAILELTGSASDVGYVLASQTLAMVAFFLAGGVWADRLPRQKVMLASDIVRAAAIGASGVLLITGSAQMWQLITLAAVFGVADGFFFPASTGLVPLVVKPHLMQEANALMGFTRYATGVAGPAVAGIIVATAGAGVALVLDAGTFLVSAWFLARMRPPPIAREVKVQNFVADLKRGWEGFRSRMWLWTGVVHFAFFHMFVAAPFFVLTPLIARDQLGGASAWATIVAGTGVGSLFGSLLAMRVKPRKPLIVALAAMIFEAPRAILIAQAASLWLITTLSVAVGLGLGLFNALWMTVLHEQIPEGELSKVTAYDWLGSFAFFPVGLMVVGPVAEAVGPDRVMWFSGIWVALSTVAILSIPDVRRVRRRSDAEGAPGGTPSFMDTVI